MNFLACNIQYSFQFKTVDARLLSSPSADTDVVCSVWIRKQSCSCCEWTLY